jgi:hypothetical protein
MNKRDKIIQILSEYNQETDKQIQDLSVIIKEEPNELFGKGLFNFAHARAELISKTADKLMEVCQ